MSGTFIVYIATNITNGKRYVGMTSMALNRRIASHFSQSFRGSKTALHRAIRKYGREVFDFVHVATCRNREDAQHTEIAVIKQEGTRTPAGYNMTPGGDWYHVRMSEETKARMSKARQAYWASISPEKRAAFGAKISAARTGKKQPNSKGGTPLKGIKRSAEFCSKVSAGLKRHFSTDNTVDKSATLF